MVSAEDGDQKDPSRLSAAGLRADPSTAEGPLVTGDETGPVTRRRLVRDRTATFAVFAAFGVVAGTWFSRIPAIRDQLDADLRTLGFVMVCFSVGSVLSMPFAGRLIQHFSARRICLIGSITGSLLVPVLGLFRDPRPFGAVLLLVGVCYGLWNVTDNVHGAAVQARFGRSLLPAFQGAGSAGIILGAAVGSLLAGAGIAPFWHFMAVMPLLVVTVSFAVPHWNDWGSRTPTDRLAGTAARPRDHRVSTKPATRSATPILLVGLLAFSCALIEGATSDWLAIHAHDDKDLTKALAAAVYTTYAVSVTIGRFAGGPLIDRLGRVRMIRFCGLVVAGGVAGTIVLPGAGVFLGAVLWGLGIAVVQPLTVTAASDLGGPDAPRTVATVSAMAWSAFLIGAPLIDLLGHGFGLGAALWVVVGLAVVLVLLAGVAAPPKPAIGQATASGSTN